MAEASRILVVDDDRLCRIAMGDLLKKNGYSVIETGNGHEALGKFETYDFCLVLTDWQMPRLNGLELCVKIKQTNQGLPVIIHSASAHNLLEEMIIASKIVPEHRPNAIFEKPLEWKTVLEEIKKLIALYQESKERQKSLP